MILFKDNIIPLTHDTSSDQERSSSVHMTDEVHQWLDYLVQRHLFDPNYGAKKVCIKWL
jgi:hypothetical protein